MNELRVIEIQIHVEHTLQDLLWIISRKGYNAWQKDIHYYSNWPYVTLLAILLFQYLRSYIEWCALNIFRKAIKCQIFGKTKINKLYIWKIICFFE